MDLGESPSARCPSGVTIRRVRPSELDELFGLHLDIVSGLSSPALYRRSSREHFSNHIGPKGICLGAFRFCEMVAYALIGFPGGSSENLGRLIGLTGSELLDVVHMEECGVARAFRNLGLHTLLSTKRLRIARELGYGQALVTVAPNNLPSLKVQFAHGFQIVAHREVYGGVPRFIMRKRLSAQADFLQGHASPILFENSDPRVIEHLDRGYIGVGADISQDIVRIKLARPLEIETNGSQIVVPPGLPSETP